MANCRLTNVPRSRAYSTSLRLRSRIYNNSLGERLLFRAWNSSRSKQASSQQRRQTRSFGSMKASQSIHQFPAEVMPLQKSLGGLNWCPSIHHPSTTEKISISLRLGLGLRSPIVERNKYIE